MSSPVLIEQIDSAIDVLLSDPDVAIPNMDSETVELLGVASELQTLPHPDFRSQLKFELMERAYAESGAAPPELRVLDTIAARATIGEDRFVRARNKFCQRYAARAMASMECIALTSRFQLLHTLSRSRYCSRRACGSCTQKPTQPKS